MTARRAATFTRFASMIPCRGLAGAADHHGPPKVDFWKDPMSPSKWKEEHFVIVSLSGWGCFSLDGTSSSREARTMRNWWKQHIRLEWRILNSSLQKLSSNILDFKFPGSILIGPKKEEARIGDDFWVLHDSAAVEEGNDRMAVDNGSESDFEDGNPFYRLLKHGPFIPKCHNFRGSVNDSEPKNAAVVNQRLARIMSAIVESYASDEDAILIMLASETVKN
ncbi:1D-myo-inositol 2-amino-2-deoxy-alpha-D-glucopyranoside ligase [Olea europaea subsp. europaea]|uniref:1D-myo-inositol 2-amino-2-deoxy-alpha-D-glucopyranoside ligase n=1 Tax=Olea europaea subsp. europaea TaxID=158383 RepID=A0A8S0V4M6_OLEEU|nr:1D-myo-inositol 2-amino-2-deoxy-alpha-D-glucopyranoside ligase [Olea europaea subsp. europaea]